MVNTGSYKVFAIQLCTKRDANYESANVVSRGVYPANGGRATTDPLRVGSYNGKIWEGTGKYYVKLKVYKGQDTNWAPSFEANYIITRVPVEFNGKNVTFNYGDMEGSLNAEG